MNEKRGPWFLVTGVLIGLVVGFVYARFVSPVEYIDTIPSTLSMDLKNTYRLMIALSYQSDGNLGRAKARLDLLKDDNPMLELAGQAQEIQAKGGSSKEEQALKSLAAALAHEPTPTSVATRGSLVTETAVEVALGPTASETLDLGQAVQTATAGPTFPPTPAASFTPRPTPTILTALTLSYSFKDKQVICDPSLPKGLLEIQVQDKNGEALPGARIAVAWSGGEDDFFTGLYPEINPGYADFMMEPKKIYRVRIGDEGDWAENISVPECEAANNGGSYSGGMWVLFTGS